MDTKSSIDTHIKQSLLEAGEILFPNNGIVENLIKAHVWRDSDYVGSANGIVNSWKGWSLNLSLLDIRYRTVYVDVVENMLSTADKLRLFGQEFADAIPNTDRFVVILVTDFPLNTIDEIRQHGFIPRTLSRAIHPTVVISEDEFLQTPAFYWAAKVTKLITLQRILSIHRKPIDSNELPLQRLIYVSGYLHRYILESGLVLHDLTPPRNAGQFGHDLHIMASNPKLGFYQPFSIGVEVYVTSIGYHVDTIPAYANEFDLSGMIVIAKDNPYPTISRLKHRFNKDLKKAPLIHMGEENVIGIHHLSLDKIIIDLNNLRSGIDALLG
jgi:hypothetical protein